MNTDKMMLLVEEVEGADAIPVDECTVDDFVKNNGDGISDVDVADICHLGVGSHLMFGGGAAPLFRVTRTA